ncbi:MAG: ABC transporter ATP-binding protein [bacterium]|nr:ABC transporter ATP-binding protein [bacterium]
MAFLELQGIAKSFGETVVLREISLEVEEGETLVLLGPSGSGKTTLLRLIAGFETVDRGEVLVAGKSVGALPAAERNFGLVFQHYALFPHLSVGENVSFGLESRGRSKGDIRGAVERALEQVDLAGFADRRIDAISGGQQQRVALARALAPEPRLLLLDEPLSNLDPELRERTRQELAGTLEHIGITAVWVTHEQEEAFDVGTKVAVLNHGRLEQIGSPEELYRRPATPFVAGFVGRASVLRGRLVADALVELDASHDSSLRFPVAVDEDAAAIGRRVEVYVRPEAWEQAGREDSGVLDGEVTERRFAGRENLVRVKLDQGSEIEFATEGDLAPGDRLGLRLRSGSIVPTAFPVERDPE